MKRLMVTTGFVVLLSSSNSHAQSGAVSPPADAGHASQAGCVILKRMGRLDRAKSRLPSLGISGKQFRYVEGKLPEGFSPRHKMTDHDVRDLQARGVQVLALESHYTSEDLKEARANCRGETGKTLSQAERKAPPALAPAAIASTQALAPKATTERAPVSKADDPAPSTDAMEAALVDVSSTPSGADVYIDEHFFGRTPSTTIILEPGNHKIAIKKDGFVVWQKNLKLPRGPTNVAAELLPKAK